MKQEIQLAIISVVGFILSFIFAQMSYNAHGGLGAFYFLWCMVFIIVSIAAGGFVAFKVFEGKGD